MNKTLILVICDFLLLSMLALAKFDPPEEAPVPALDATAASAGIEAEIIRLLEESLHSEEASRENLSENLAETRRNLQEKARVLKTREATLAETQKHLEAKSAEAGKLASAKAATEAEKQRIVEEKAQLDAQRAELAESVGSLKQESAAARARLTRTQEELIAHEIALAEREAQLKDTQEEAGKLAKEREELLRQLKVTETERTLLAQNLVKEQQEKAAAITRAEQLGHNVSQLGRNVSQLGQGIGQLGQNVSQLGRGITTVAESSETIRQELQEARPQNMNEVFTRFQNNRAVIKFTATEKGLIGGDKQKTYRSKSILITDTRGDTYLVTHSNNSPFALGKRGKVLGAQLEVEIAGRSLPIPQISFLSADPRLIHIPLPQNFVDACGLQTFDLALQPARWEEAILVKSDESNFGRTEFRRLIGSDKFLKMNRPALGEMFSDFASSKGDLAFTKNGRFIGILTNTNHTVVIKDFLASDVLNLGPQFNPGQTENTIDRLKDRLRKLPGEVR